MECDLMLPFICKEEAMFKTMRFEMERVLWFQSDLDLTSYAEKLGQLSGRNELALSVKWMPMRSSPICVL